MANESDGAMFPDLLSAALSESGLGDDLEDLMGNASPNLGLAQHNVNYMTTPTTPVGTRFVLSTPSRPLTPGTQVVRVAGATGARTPSGVRHVQIVRTRTPVPNAQSAPGIRRLLVRTSTPASSPVAPVQRLIVRGNQPNTAIVTGNPQKLVRTPSGAIKVVKLMPRQQQPGILTAQGAPSSPLPAAQVVSTLQNVQVSSGQIKTVRVAPGTISKLTGSVGTQGPVGTRMIRFGPNGTIIPTTNPALNTVSSLPQVSSTFSTIRSNMPVHATSSIITTPTSTATILKAVSSSAMASTNLSTRVVPVITCSSSSAFGNHVVMCTAGPMNINVPQTTTAVSTVNASCVKPETKEPPDPAICSNVKTEIKQEDAVSERHEEKQQSNMDISEMKSEVKTEIKSEVKTELISEVKSEIKSEVNSQDEEDVKTNNVANENDFEMDFFGALQELQETNKKAEEFEKSQAQQAVATNSTMNTFSSLSETITAAAQSQPLPLTSPLSALPSRLTESGIAVHGGRMVNSIPIPRMDPPTLLTPQQRVSSPVSLINHNVANTLGRTISSNNLETLNTSGGVRVMKILPGGVRIGTPPPPGQRIFITSSSASVPATQPLYPSGTKITLGGPGEGVRVVTPGGSASRMLANAQGVPVNGSHQPQQPISLTDKDVTRMWANEDISLKKLQQQVNMINPGGPIMPGLPLRPVHMEEEVEEEEEELGHAETYNDYMPPKLKIGIRHPDTVVETSSLASVEPPDVWYKLAIPENVIDHGFLSALQLESIVYACQKHECLLPSGHRAGYLIGDGAGVGKGRTVAGIIYENYLQGRKRSLWLSVSNDLRVDAERDLRDIGAKIEVHPLNKFKYAKISSKINGHVKKGVIFATYSSLIGESSASGKYRTRFKQLIHWLGKEDFDGPIVFDECHKAKNLCPTGSSKPTKTGLTVLQLQNKLPKARIIYASATGASEPRNMAYMTRLGLWGPGTPFKEFNDFIQAVEKRGVGAMELVAMDMKLRGMYIARQLSFHGVSFRIEEVPIARDFTGLYNAAVKLWVDAREKFQLASELMDCDQRTKKTIWGQFWSSHQRFFKYLCISAKVPYCVKIARQAIKDGKCVVIGLQSTGEARTLEALEDMGELNDFVSTAKGVIQSLVDRHFPAPDRKKTYGFLGLSGIFDDSPSSPQRGQKRKRKKVANSSAKRVKEDWTDESDSDPSEKELSRPSTPSAPSSASEMSDEDEDEDEESENEDFNPFAKGSDSDDDDDPWLKKKNKMAKKHKAKEEQRKKKEEEKRKKKEAKRKKKEKKNKDDSDDEFDDIDNQMDKALQAVGLKIGKENSMGPFSSARQSLKDGTNAVEQAIQMKIDLLAHIDKIGDKLPANTLDELIDSLGGTDCVAEMTGRKGRVVSTDDGTIQYESRSESDIPLEVMNLAEKQRFMDGEKNIAVISEAASSGISLQADRRAHNQKRRVHITLELPWSADRAIQQFGRTHRSNQVSAPEYMFLISELAGEQRFASTVAKRLESLGALTHGDRRATESRDLSRFNIDNKYGRTALEAVMKSVLELESPLVPPPSNYIGNFFKDVRTGLIGVGMVNWDDRVGYASLEKDYNNISKFLNRILGMEVHVQNALFSYFNETLSAVIMQAKRNGRWDMGILDLGKHGEAVKRLETKTFVGTFSGAQTKIELHTLSVERGMSYNQAMEIWHEHSRPDDGFYLSFENRNVKRAVSLAVQIQGKRRERLFNVYKPNSGLQGKPETLDDLKAKAKKILPDEAKQYWEDQFYHSAHMCSHMYWRGNCKRLNVGLGCEVGLRSRTYYILSGSVLSVWTKVEQVLASVPGGFATRMQIIRMRTDDGSKIVGTLIPANALKALVEAMSADSQRSYNTQHGISAQEEALATKTLFGSPSKSPMKTQSYSNYSNFSVPSNLSTPGQLHRISTASNLNSPGQLHRISTASNLNTPGQLHRISTAPAHLSRNPSQFLDGSLSHRTSQNSSSPVSISRPVVISKPPSPVPEITEPQEYLSMPSFL